MRTSDLRLGDGCLHPVICGCSYVEVSITCMNEVKNDDKVRRLEHECGANLDAVVEVVHGQYPSGTVSMQR